MASTRKSPLPHLVVLLALLAAGVALWRIHASAWDLGGRSPVLSFDAAQYALAGRELAERGRLATPFALPVELVRHAQPPWPLAVVQPGLVLVEGLVERLAPDTLSLPGRTIPLTEPHQREWLALVAPILGYLAIAILLAFGASAVLARLAPATPGAERAAAGLVVGACFLLDPEAQHFATGGFTEHPFTFGLACALLLVATGRAGAWPLFFGVTLGLAGAFRGSMAWLLPALVAGGAAVAPAGRRANAALLVLIGYALPLAGWWIYKWHWFGSPLWDLSLYSLWDGAGGHTWLSLTHLAEPPELPSGSAAISLLGEKLTRNAAQLGLAMSAGLRGLWIGALLIWLVASRSARSVGAAGWTLVLVGVLSLIAAALGSAWLRYLFPARVLLEAGGLLALWGLLGRAPGIGADATRVLRVTVAALALFWGAWQTARGVAEARATAERRGLPSVATLRDLAQRVEREVPAGEPVMSSLGPTLAWYARRPVVHLALSPADIEACRRRLNLRNVLVVFRDARTAWPQWAEVVERPDEVTRRPEWNVSAVRHWVTDDGFQAIWLELGPARPQLAGR